MISESEIRAVSHVLTLEHAGKTSDEVAKLCIQALDNVRSSIWRPVGAPLRVGDTFKGLITSKVHHVAWIGYDFGQLRAWIITGDSEYGYFGHPDQDLWKWRTKTSTRQETIDKMVANEDGIKVGDILVESHRIIEV